MILNAGIASVCAVMIGALALDLGPLCGLLAIGSGLVCYAMLEAVRNRRAAV